MVQQHERRRAGGVALGAEADEALEHPRIAGVGRPQIGQQARVDLAPVGSARDVVAPRPVPVPLGRVLAPRAVDLGQDLDHAGRGAHALHLGEVGEQLALEVVVGGEVRQHEPLGCRVGHVRGLRAGPRFGLGLVGQRVGHAGSSSSTRGGGGETGRGRGPAGPPREQPGRQQHQRRDLVVVDVAVGADEPLRPGDDAGAVDGDHAPRDAGLLRRRPGRSPARPRRSTPTAPMRAARDDFAHAGAAAVVSGPCDRPGGPTSPRGTACRGPGRGRSAAPRSGPATIRSASTRR